MLLALGLIGIALAAHWFDREGLRDNADGKVSLIDVVYFTMITVTTVGYGDIVPVTDRARLLDTFAVTPVRLFVWLIFLGIAYDFLFKRVWEKWRMRVLQRDLSGHVIVAGHGTSGTEAVMELKRRGKAPDAIVVIDPQADSLERAEAEGAVVLAGDATRNATLEAVQVARASALIVTAGRDDTSILIVLTARRLAPVEDPRDQDAPVPAARLRFHLAARLSADRGRTGAVAGTDSFARATSTLGRNRRTAQGRPSAPDYELGHDRRGPPSCPATTHLARRSRDRSRALSPERRLAQ